MTSRAGRTRLPSAYRFRTRGEENFRARCAAISRESCRSSVGWEFQTVAPCGAIKKARGNRPVGPEVPRRKSNSGLLTLSCSSSAILFRDNYIFSPGILARSFLFTRGLLSPGVSFNMNAALKRLKKKELTRFADISSAVELPCFRLKRWLSR